MKRFVILGSGMAGIGAAHRLREQGLPAVIYDKNAYYGGHTASFTNSLGFTFDDGPHVSFTGDKRIQELFAESVNHRYETVRYRVNNYWKGYWIKHPAQCNLYGLPTDLQVAILKDFIQAREHDGSSIRNYEDWLFSCYGESFARTFPMEYTKKFHTTTASNMSTDWLGPRMYRPKLEEVLLGALTPSTPDYHYVTEFRYPSRGGFVSYFNLFLREAEFKLGHEVIRIDPKSRHLLFANRFEDRYDGLISSIPLPNLIRLIIGVPADVEEASRRLSCTSCVLVNVGVGREDISDNSVSYFYDQDISFARLSFPSLMSRNNAPPGCSSIQAEIYFSEKYRPLDREPRDFIQPVLADLHRCGLLKESDKIVSVEARLSSHGQVIFDLDRSAALRTVKGYLDEIGIAYCGRYGDWEYTWTDEAFRSGENAAQKAVDRTRAPI